MTPPAAATPRRVVVVEDEAAIRELVRLHLELAGFSLEETSGGGHALETAPDPSISSCST